MKDIGDHQLIHLSFMNVSMSHLVQVLRVKLMIQQERDIIALLDMMEIFVQSVLRILRRKIVKN